MGRRPLTLGLLTRGLLTLVLVGAVVGGVAHAHGGCAFRGPGGELPPDICVRNDPPPPPPTLEFTATVQLRVAVPEGVSPADVSFALAPGSPGSSARGVQAKADGSFSVPCATVPVRYVVSAPGCAPVLTPWIVAPDELDNATASAGPARVRVSLELPIARSIAGRVTCDGDTSHVRVSVIPARARIPESFAVLANSHGWRDVSLGVGGEFRFANLKQGGYAIVLATPEGVVRVVRSVRAGITGLEIALDGTLLAPRPVEGLRADAGRTTLRVTADGTTTVHVAAWRRGETQSVAEAHGVDVSLAVPLGEGLILVVADPRGGVRALSGVDPASVRVSLPLGPTRTVTGRVVRAEGGTPVVRARVRAVPHLDVPDRLFAESPYLREAVTAADGRFVLTNVSGPVRLLVEAPGLVAESVSAIAAQRDEAGDLRMVERLSP